MRVKYDSLNEGLKTISYAFDKKSGDKMKVLFFHDGYIVAKSPFALCKVKVEFEEDFVNCAVMFETLQKIVNGYSSLLYTRVEYVDISLDNDTILVEVSEVPVEDELSKFGKVSSFRLPNKPTPEKMLSYFEKELPNESDKISRDDMNKYISTLYPLVSDATKDASSVLSFSEDYVFFMSSINSAFVKNTLPEVMHDVEISSTGLNLFKRYFELYEFLDVVKQDKELLIFSEDGGLVSSIVVKKVSMQSKRITDSFNTDRGVEVDRRYFHEVLNRLAMFDVQTSITVLNEDLVVISDNYTQNIPISVDDNGKLLKRGNIDGVSFKVNTGILSKLFLGQDSLMSSKSRIYFIPKGSAAMELFVTDSSGEWMSKVNVQTTSGVRS